MPAARARPVEGAANAEEIALPRGLLEAVALLEECEELVEIFGRRFVATCRAIKEREYLLLNV